VLEDAREARLHEREDHPGEELDELIPALPQDGDQSLEQRQQHFLSLPENRLDIWMEQRTDRLVPACLQILADIVREQLVEGRSHHVLDRLLRLGMQLITGRTIWDELNPDAGRSLKCPLHFSLHGRTHPA